MRGYYGDITGIDGGLHGVCCSLLLAADGHRDERACAEDRKAVALAPRPAFDEIFSAARAFVATQALTRKQQNRPQKSGLGKKAASEECPSEAVLCVQEKMNAGKDEPNGE